MGFSKKHQIEVGKKGAAAESQKWVIAGIAIVAPLKQINTAKQAEEEDDNSTTPTALESRIPEKLPCPPPPRKRRPKPSCHFNGVREFFNPPDLESVFICHAERA